jgi:glycosyltransferase involved in cell wall biosynthesis
VSLTIVIPTRNRLALLRETLGSVRAQVPRPEIVVVDDRSTDGTPEWLNEQRDLEAVGLAEHSERSAARNAGLEKVRTPYVLFLDDDDLIAPRGLERLESALASAPRAVVALGARQTFGAEVGAPQRLPKMRRVLGFRRAAWFGMVVYPGQMLLRTSTVRSIGGWSNDHTGDEDRELLIRLSSEGPMVTVPAVTFRHRIHAERPVDPDSHRQMVEGTGDMHARILATLDPVSRRMAQRTERARQRIGGAWLRYVNGEDRGLIGEVVRGLAYDPMVAIDPLTRRFTWGTSFRALAATLGAQHFRSARGTRQ